MSRLLPPRYSTISSIDNILDAIDIKYIESYLRKKKLEKLNNGKEK